jgi:hypothetical protein
MQRLHLLPGLAGSTMGPMDTAAARKRRFREILDTLNVGARIKPGPLFFELHKMLSQHPNWATKTAPGIKAFGVRQDDWGRKCFELVHLDDSTTDISFVKAAKGKQDSHRTRVLKAFRKPVNDQILAVSCPRGWHVDHVQPFEQLVELFLDGQGLKFYDVVVVSKANQYGAELLDVDLANAFSHFHRRHAVLRAIPAKENLSKGSRRPC